jgi:hypothetical protein
MKKLFIVSLVVIGMLGVFSPPARATSYDLCGKELSIEGFIRQEFAFGVAPDNRLKTNQSGLHSAYQMWYLDTDLWLTKNLEVRGILRLWGDLSYQLLSDNSRFEKYFMPSKHSLNWDDDVDQILREFYVSYSTPKFLIKMGKQQVAWGEADGLRLMDVINPLDVRRGPFYDTQGYEEVRIPKWLIKTEFFGPDLWKFYNNSLELIWNPGDVRETQNLLPTYANAQLGGRNNGFGFPWWGGGVPVGSQNSWGIWGIPVNFVPLPVRLFKQERSTSIENSEFGGRVKFSINNTAITLNYWQGFQADEVLKFRGIVPDLANGGIFPPLGVVSPSVLLMDRVYKRMRVAGFTLSKELDGVGPLFGQPANPVLRVEAQYDFDHPFNTGLNTATDFIVIKKYDQVKYMVGFDWPVRCALINPQKNIFLSAQMFHIYTVHWENGVNSPRPAPFYSWTYPMNQFYSSLLVRTEYRNETIVPSALLVWDHSNNSGWVKTAVGFKYGNHWRPEIGWLWIKKNTSITQNVGFPQRNRDDWKAFGTFEDRDEVYIRIQYQF